MVDKLIKGKRYWWYINNYEDRTQTGIFTGQYNYYNGNPIFITKFGERWAIPIEDVNIKKKGKKK